MFSGDMELLTAHFSVGVQNLHEVMDFNSKVSL